MEIDKDHISSVLREAIEALKREDAVALKDLSNRTLHCATCAQESGSISIAVMNYALSKIIERGQHKRIKNWDNFIKRISLYYSIAAKCVEKDDLASYESALIEARKSLTGISDLKQAIKETLTKASINKASRLYEHGLSLGQTAKLLGVTHWDLAEYAGQRIDTPASMSRKINAKVRAEMAMEFFS